MLSLWGLWAFHVNGIEYHTALTLARKFSPLAATSPYPNDRLMGERMIAISHHFLGDQNSARRHIERALRDFAAPSGKRQIVHLELDPRVTARVHLARKSVAARISGPCDARSRAEYRGRAQGAARHLVQLCFAPRGMSGRAMDRRSVSGWPLRRHVA